MIPKCGTRGQPGFSLWKLTTKKELPRKIDGTRLTVAKILHNLLAADHLERLFNNLCSGVGLDDATTLILPSGSASNETLPNPSSCVEALCSSSCRSSTRQNCLCSLGGALYSPTARQITTCHVLALHWGQPLWTTAAWKSGVEQQHTDQTNRRKSSPLAAQRLEEQATIAMSKGQARPAKKPATRQTPFTLQRSRSTKNMGV